MNLSTSGILPRPHAQSPEGARSSTQPSEEHRESMTPPDRRAMTFSEFEDAIAQIPRDLIVLGEESGRYTAEIEWGEEWYCVTYAEGNWTLSLDRSTQAIAIHLIGCDLGSDDTFPTHALLVDVEEAKLYVGPYDTVRAFLRDRQNATNKSAPIAPRTTARAVAQACGCR